MTRDTAAGLAAAGCPAAAGEAGLEARRVPHAVAAAAQTAAIRKYRPPAGTRSVRSLMPDWTFAVHGRFRLGIPPICAGHEAGSPWERLCVFSAAQVVGKAQVRRQRAVLAACGAAEKEHEDLLDRHQLFCPPCERALI
jgi:hypothetical protein